MRALMRRKPRGRNRTEEMGRYKPRQEKPSAESRTAESRMGVPAGFAKKRQKLRAAYPHLPHVQTPLICWLQVVPRLPTQPPPNAWVKVSPVLSV